MPFQPLSISDCPLLDNSVREDLAAIEEFGKACEQFRFFEEQFPGPFANDSEIQKMIGVLQKVRAELSKRRYAIGFIGPTQSGKSTAFNYVLDALDAKDQPCKEGGGDNTTATVSRIRKGTRSLTLIYMTPEQVHAKREYLCKATSFEPEMSDRQILERIPTLIREVQDGGAPLSLSGETILPSDIDRLKELLECLARHGTAVRDVAYRDATHRYEERDRFLNYGPSSDQTKALLREAEITYESEHLPEILEMFDLPGPGAKSGVDEWTTRQYLGEMQGVMLFVNVTRLGDQAVEKLYGHLRDSFKTRLSKRVWVVFTRWDSPTRPALIGDGNLNVFTSIRDFLREKRIDPAQARFVCRNWYLATDSQSYVREHFKQQLGGGAYLPETLQRVPELEPAFMELFDRGGIPSLRKLILEDLPKEVRAEIVSTATSLLKGIRESLRHKFENFVRRQTANDQQQDVAGRCKMKLDELSARIEDELAPYEATAKSLRGKLQAKFLEECPSGEILTRYRSAAEYFRSHSKTLEKQLQSLVEAEAVPELYRFWQADFDALPVVRVLDYEEGCGAAWRSFAAEDERSISNGGYQFPTFLDPRLFDSTSPDAERDLEVNGEAYREMMLEKINLVAQQVVHAVRVKLTERGHQIKEDLDELLRQKGDPKVADGDSLNEALEEMKRLAS